MTTFAEYTDAITLGDPSTGALTGLGNIRVTVVDIAAATNASIFSDSGGTTPKSNPFTTATGGATNFFAADGKAYRLDLHDLNSIARITDQSIYWVATAAPGTWEPAFSGYKELAHSFRHGVVTPGVASGILVLPNDSNASGTTVVPIDFRSTAFYIDPADYSAGARTVKGRVRTQVAANSITAGMSFPVGLYPVATIGGSAGNLPTVATLGSVVSGSQTSGSTVAANTVLQSASSDFTLPAAGHYVLAVATPSTMITNACVSILAELQVRQV